MRCVEFLKEWSLREDGCDAATLSETAQAHLAMCAACRAEVDSHLALAGTLRWGLAVEAESYAPRPQAVAAAVMAAIAAVETPAARQPALKPLPRRSRWPSARLNFIPAPVSALRWAVAAGLIAAATLFSHGQPFTPTTIYADMTATAAAASPSVTPSATFAASAPGTPVAVSFAAAVATPAPH